MFAPQTSVNFLANADVDIDMVNVREFSSVAEQEAYFQSKIKYSYPTCSVRDVHGYSGYLLAPIGSAALQYPGLTIDGYYDCNYIMYRNNTLSNKWFYAFLGTPEIINSNTVRIPYTIDMWQTWRYDVSFGQCLIARETVADDTVGRWLMPEDVETGEYVMLQTSTGESDDDIGVDIVNASGWDSTPCVMIPYVYDPVTSDDAQNFTITEKIQGLMYEIPGFAPKFAGGFLMDGIYQCATYIKFDVDPSWPQQTIDNIINSINNELGKLVKDGQIQRAYPPIMAPKYFFREQYGPGEKPKNETRPRSVIVNGVSSPNSFGSYTPKNKKLFTQQFNYMVIDNGMGTQQEYGYEYFSGDSGTGKPAGSPVFVLYAQASMSPSAKLSPIGYRCPNGKINNHYSIMLGGFPQGSFSYSQAQNEYNANRRQHWVNGLASTYGIIKNAVTGYVQGASNVIGSIGTSGPVDVMGVLAGAGQVFNTTMQTQIDIDKRLAILQDKARVPNIAVGQADSNIQFALGRQTFYQYQYQIQPQYAKKVDDYFSAYGYRVDEFGVPTLKNRTKWDYVQCVDPVVNGNAPEDAKRVIAQMLSNGIRAWHSGAAWMDYTQDNPIR